MCDSSLMEWAAVLTMVLPVLVVMWAGAAYIVKLLWF